jgi:acyl dehydratase
MVGAGIDELRWPRPTRPGDRLRIVCEVIDARPMMSNPHRGLVRLKVTTFNQDNEVAQRMYSTIVMPIAAATPAEER